jgi:hypothetical protein
MMDNQMLQNLLMMNEMEGNGNFQQQDRLMMQAQNPTAQGSYNGQMMGDQQQDLGKPNAALLNQMFNGNFNRMAGLQNLQAQFAAPENGLFQASSASLENMAMGNLAGNRMGSGLHLSQMHNLHNQHNQQFGSSSFLTASPQVPQAALSQSNFNWNLSNGSLAANAVQSGSFGNLGSFNSMSMMGRNQLENAIPQRNAQWAHMPSAPPLSAAAVQSAPAAAEAQPKADPYSQNGLLGPWSAASAELLGDLMLSQGQGKKPRKKQKDKPKRPLSAYNIFFKEERQRILKEIPDKEIADDSKKPLKRKGKKTPHGKIDFQSLAKIIGKRWQELSESELDIYKSKSQADKLRYKKEMEAYIVPAEDKET